MVKEKSAKKAPKISQEVQALVSNLKDVKVSVKSPIKTWTKAKQSLTMVNKLDLDQKNAKKAKLESGPKNGVTKTATENQYRSPSQL